MMYSSFEDLNIYVCKYEMLHWCPNSVYLNTGKHRAD